MADKPTTIADAIQQSFPAFGEVPKDQLNAGVTASKDDIGATITVNKSLGKDASISASGSWWKDKGYQVAAWFGVKF